MGDRCTSFPSPGPIPAICSARSLLFTGEVFLLSVPSPISTSNYSGLPSSTLPKCPNSTESAIPGPLMRESVGSHSPLLRFLLRRSRPGDSPAVHRCRHRLQRRPCCFDEYRNDIKPSFMQPGDVNPTGNAPVVELNGEVMTQFYAILRHFSRVLGNQYDGDTQEEMFWVDQMCDITIDWPTKIGGCVLF